MKYSGAPEFRDDSRSVKGQTIEVSMRWRFDRLTVGARIRTARAAVEGSMRLRHLSLAALISVAALVVHSRSADHNPGLAYVWDPFFSGRPFVRN